jgi:hypothetical protein
MDLVLVFRTSLQLFSQGLGLAAWVEVVHLEELGTGTEFPPWKLFHGCDLAGGNPILPPIFQPASFTTGC